MSILAHLNLDGKLPNVIVTDVADLQESEIQTITQKLEETQN